MISAFFSNMAEPNPNFLCPITHEVMADPVIAPDGITYDRAAIEVRAS